MATKSISKNINIHKREQVRKLVDALERASQWRGQEIQISRTVSELKSKEEITKFFEAVK